LYRTLWRHLSRDGSKLILGRHRGTKTEEDDEADDNPDDDFLEIVEQLVAGVDLSFGMDDEERLEQERLKDEKKKTAMMRTVSGHASQRHLQVDEDAGRRSMSPEVDSDVKSHYMYHAGKASEWAGHGGESKWGGTPVSGATIAKFPRFYRAAGRVGTFRVILQ
jgi:hypothetical protein